MRLPVRSVFGCVVLCLLLFGVVSARAANPYGERPVLPSAAAPEPPSSVHDTNDPSNVVVNGGFESGLANWIVVDNPGPLFALSSQPAGYFLWFNSTTPTEGSFDAITGWDGAVSGTITLAQDVVLGPAADELLFDYRAGWDLFNYGATLSREFRVQVQPSGGGAPLLDQLVLTAPVGTIESVGPWQEGAVDVSTFAGQAVRLVFLWTVPEAGSGPAEFELDNVGVSVLTIQEQIDAAPPGGTVTLLPGVYSGPGNRDLDFGGKDITLQGAGIGQTVVDCEGLGRGMIFNSGETPSSLVQGITFVNGLAADGGGLYISGASPQFVDSSFEYCTAATSTAGNLIDGARGGAVFIDSASPSFTGCLFLQNMTNATAGGNLYGSGNGGAVMTQGPGASVFNTCDFVQNQTSAVGGGDGSNNGLGGAVCSFGSVVLTGCLFEFNQSYAETSPPFPDNSDGGALFSVAPNLIIDGCVFTGNHASFTGRGGGVFVNSGTVSIIATSFNGNDGSLDGGGLFLQGGAASVDECTFLQNISSGGGGANVSGGTGHVFTDCEFLQNSALDGGGVEIFNTGSADFIRCRFLGNTASRWGGGIQLSNNTIPDITECLIAGNVAAQGGGGIGAYASAQAALVSTTVAGNRSGQNGGGVALGLGAFTNGGITMESSILWGNTAAGVGNDAWIKASYYLTVDCSVLDPAEVSNSGTFAPTDCRAQDPWFCGPVAAALAPTTAGDYTIAVDSPAAAQNLACGVRAGSEPVGCGGGAISAVADVPNDQGRQVRVTWDASNGDVFGSPDPIFQYSLWRRIEPGLLTAGGFGLGDARGSRAELPADLASPPGSWDFLGTIPASAQAAYNMVVPTLCDSTISEGPCLSTFFVRAHTAVPSVVFDSPGTAGYSVDNLAPGVPLNLMFADPVTLAWDEAPEADRQYYTVYGSATGVFDGTQTELGDTATESFDVTGSAYAFYLVTVTDFAGNEGNAAVASRTVGTPTGSMPTVAGLAMASPNPFRSSTRIAFDLPSSEAVRIEVFDLSGRRVRVLEEGVRPAGRHTTTWDGRTDGGVQASAGIYFVKFVVGGEAFSRKVALQR